MGTRIGRIDAHAGLWMGFRETFSAQIFSCISYLYPNFHHPRAGLSAGSFKLSSTSVYILGDGGEQGLRFGEQQSCRVGINED